MINYCFLKIILFTQMEWLTYKINAALTLKHIIVLFNKLFALICYTYYILYTQLQDLHRSIHLVAESGGF